MKAALKLPQYPDRAFDATVVTTSHAIDKKSRSLLVELQAKNDDGALQPGAFAQVRFQIPEAADALKLPASAMIFRDQAVEVATVGANNRVVMKKVEIARNFGAEVAIANGLSASDRVIANPLDSIDDGDEVRVLSATGDGRPEGGKDGASSPETSDAASRAVVQAARGHTE